LGEYAAAVAEAIFKNQEKLDSERIGRAMNYLEQALALGYVEALYTRATIFAYGLFKFDTNIPYAISDLERLVAAEGISEEIRTKGSVLLECIKKR
jgi:hypothetical protein